MYWGGACGQPPAICDFCGLALMPHSLRTAQAPGEGLGASVTLGSYLHAGGERVSMVTAVPQTPDAGLARDRHIGPCLSSPGPRKEWGREGAACSLLGPPSWGCEDPVLGTQASGPQPGSSHQPWDPSSQQTGADDHMESAPHAVHSLPTGQRCFTT